MMAVKNSYDYRFTPYEAAIIKRIHRDMKGQKGVLSKLAKYYNVDPKRIKSIVYNENYRYIKPYGYIDGEEVYRREIRDR